MISMLLFHFIAEIHFVDVGVVIFKCGDDFLLMVADVQVNFGYFAHLL